MFKPFLLEPNVDSPNNNMYFLSHISIHAWSYFYIFLFIQKKLSIKDYLLLIYSFMCVIIFLRIIILSFQSHQTAFLARVWEWRGIGKDSPEIYIYIFFHSNIDLSSVPSDSFGLFGKYSLAVTKIG